MPRRATPTLTLIHVCSSIGNPMIYNKGLVEILIIESISYRVP
jgi:hypothetical protein